MRAFALLLLIALLPACATTRQARQVDTTGFLDDYSRLQPGGGEYESKLRWLNETAGWASYDKVMIDPITLWRNNDARTTGVSERDAQTMANNFHALLSAELSNDYTLVDEIQPRTIRIQAAITGAESGNGSLDVVSTVTPIGIGVSSLSEFVSGRPSFVGEMSIEFRMLDAESGEMLFEGVDARVGGKNISKGVDEWADVTNACRWYAGLARYRLCTQRGGDNCQPPRE